MKVTLDQFQLGDVEYAMEQAGVRGSVELPTAALLTRPGYERPRASLQQLHTDAPELVIYEWVGAGERVSLEAWQPDLLTHAQTVWREHYNPDDYADPGPMRAPGDGAASGPGKGIDVETCLIAALANLALALSVGIWVAPEGTPRLLPAAVGTLVMLAAQFAVNLWVCRNLRKALRDSLRLAAFLSVALCLLAGWVWSGHFPGGAYT